MRPSQTESRHLLMGFAISNNLRSAHGVDVSSRFQVSQNTGLDADANFDASAAQW